MASPLAGIAERIKNKKKLDGEETPVAPDAGSTAADQMDAPASAEPADSEEDKRTSKQRMAAVIGALAPTLIGALAGGYEGGASGAAIGKKTLDDINQEASEEDKRRTELARDAAKSKFEIGEKDAQRKFEGTQKEKDRANQLLLKRMELGARGEKEAPAPQTVEERLAKLSKEKQDTLMRAREALGSVYAMDAALKGGDSTFSLVGDNDYTRASRQWQEALGRMQSGGAITKDEEKRFAAFAPRVTDSAGQQAKKLAQMESIMKERLKLTGFSPEELGATGQLTYMQDKAAQKGISIPGVGEANASMFPPDPEDSIALSWAKEQYKKNPKDEQAITILRQNGM